MNTLPGITLRDDQAAAVTDATGFLADARPGDRRLYASPTGSGKSIVELSVLLNVPDAWLVTPRVEIIAGMVAKLGVTVPTSEVKLLRLADQLRITTPIRLRNRLLKGDTAPPTRLILDEAHHHAASSWQDLDALCDCPAVGFTATPFRGTPASTRAFLAQWGEPTWVLTFAQAVQRGVVAMPECRIEPLVDDDEIDVQNGEFVASRITSATGDKLADVVDMAAKFLDANGRLDTPTMYAVPTTELVSRLAAALRQRGVPAVTVTQDTKHADRQDAFESCVRRHAALVQINVVSEGVDLPIRRLVDLSPTLSPVRWLQQLGRITRPGGSSEYICCNRNLLRHAYLLEGMLPARHFASQAAKFPPSERLSFRVLGLEGVGKFKPAPLSLRDGCQGELYAVSSSDGTTITQYACVVHPLSDEPLWASRANVKKPDGTVGYTRWQRCDAPTELTGFASVPGSEVTEKQLAWWKRDAARFGLDPDCDVNRRNFVALPVLADLKIKVA